MVVGNTWLSKGAWSESKERERERERKRERSIKGMTPTT
jgi:hypothetical protein